MATVRDVLRSKANPEIHCVEPGAKVLDAIKMLADKGVGALVVTENGKLVGIVSERDYARKVMLMARSSHTAEVREIMTADVICVDPTRTVQSCLELMTEKRLRHLPVLEDGKLIGLVSIGDLVKTIIAEQQFLIGQLERYIRGDN
jgi:CBS domain-containing protein